MAARFVALAPHGMGRGVAPWGRCPLISPEDFTSPFSITYRERTHTIEREERQKNTPHNTSRNTHATRHNTLPANPANPANLANTKTWYGEGIERVRSGARLHPSGFFLDER